MCYELYQMVFWYRHDHDFEHRTLNIYNVDVSAKSQCM